MNNLFALCKFQYNGIKLHLIIDSPNFFNERSHFPELVGIHAVPSDVHLLVSEHGCGPNIGAGEVSEMHKVKFLSS